MRKLVALFAIVALASCGNGTSTKPTNCDSTSCDSTLVVDTMKIKTLPVVGK
jgi:hypothetical protein